MSSVLIATGGTIAWDARARKMLAAEELAEIAGVEFDAVMDVNSKPSWDLEVEEMEVIAEAVASAIDWGADEVVVTHGTDTLEESAWLTELVLDRDRRRTAAITFTGAMRFADDPKADGPANIVAALETSHRARGRNLGVQVNIAGRVHAARWAVKVDSTELDAFESAGSASKAPVPPDNNGTLDRGVALLKVGPVARPSIPDKITGLVLEGTGASHVPSIYHKEIASLLKKQIPVVVASRCGDPVDRTAERVVLGAGDLTAEKAAIALMVALGTTKDMNELRTWWTRLMDVRL